jgi:hypothetical protein
MAGVPLECILMLAYAVSLALIALVLEWVAHHAHRRSLGLSTAGFTYHPDSDIWKCPEDQHLLPVYSDSARRTVTYRAPAAACNACPCKAACTDSSQGREIERSNLSGLEYGMKRFHRAVSLTLLVLASVILAVELVRTAGLYPKIVLAATLTVFCVLIQHLSAKLSQSIERSQSSQNTGI